MRISGLNLHSAENRLPNETPRDLATWAGPGGYTPTALLEFYRLQTALLAEEFPDKDQSYALIQAGFPRINDLGEYLDQPTQPTQPIPTGTQQTEAVLLQGRTDHGMRFAVQHNGLQPKPAVCPGSGVHPIVVDPGFPYVGSGCPNRWVLAESTAGQVTGYQTVNSLADLADLESALENEWDNSDGIFLEIYQGLGLAAEAQVLPSGMTLADWAERFHGRRREDFPQIPDPFPLTHRHTFSNTHVDGASLEFSYVGRLDCPGAVPPAFGVITILPDLGFSDVTREPDGRLRFSILSADAGRVTLPSS